MRSDDVDRLIELETAMWVTATRCDRDWMDGYLSPTFTEFGRSGTSYTRAEILDDDVGEIDATLIDFDLRLLDDACALVTYRSIEPRGHSHRASIWKRAENDAGWQLEFHQGTPTTP